MKCTSSSGGGVTVGKEGFKVGVFDGEIVGLIVLNTLKVTVCPLLQ